MFLALGSGWALITAEMLLCDSQGEVIKDDMSSIRFS